MLGICFIETIDWLTTTNEKKKQYKACLFPAECLKIPDFFFPKDNEKDLIKQFFIPIPEKVEEEDKTKDKKKEAAAKAKKDIKKDNKKPPPGKKGAKDEPEKKVVPLLDWPKLDRDKVFVDRMNIINSLKDLLISISLEIL